MCKENSKSNSELLTMRHIECERCGRPPALCSASSKGKLDIVKFLVLEEGWYVDDYEKFHGYADNEYDDELNQKPLTLACKNGHWDVAKFLIEHEADKETALFKVVENGNSEATQFLVEQGADIDAASEMCGQYFDDDGSALLHIAVANCHLEVVRYLVEQGADKESIDRNDNTPLLRAADDNGYLHSIDVVMYLLQQGADKGKANKEGDTILHHAVRSGELDLVRYLIEHGADKERTNNDGNTPLLCAAPCRHFDVARYLLDQRADKNKANNEGDTILHHAAAYGELDLVRYLVEHGADKESPGKGPITTAILPSLTLLLLANSTWCSICWSKGQTGTWPITTAILPSILLQPVEELALISQLLKIV